MDHTINNDDLPRQYKTFVMEPPLLLCPAVDSFLILFHESQRIKRRSPEKAEFLLFAFAVPLNTLVQ